MLVPAIMSSRGLQSCLLVPGLAAAILLAPVQIAAHHSNAQFDLSRVVSFTGTVTRFEWKNPHIFVHVEIIEDNGERVTIQVEGDGTPVLIPLGWSADSLSPGDRVFIEANPARNAARRSVLGRRMIKADGSALIPNPEFFEPNRASSDESATSLSGIWLPRYEDFFGLLASAASWPLTPRGREYRSAYDVTQNPQADCIPVSSPLIMVYMVHTELEMLPDRIVMHSDWMNVERTIYLDGRSHPENGERTLQGHTVGRWEGDTLVMDTALFAEHAAGIVTGLPGSEQKRIVERLSLSNDGKVLDYEFVLEDPVYLLEPVTGSGRWDYRPDLEPAASDCDLEAAQRYLNEP